MAFTIGSGTFTNGSATVTGVTLTSGTLAYFASGTRMVVGVNPVIQEVEAIAAPTVSTITLRSAWTGTGGTYSFLANQTSEGLRDAVQAIRTNNASLQSFIDSIDTAATANSVAQRTSDGSLNVNQLNASSYVGLSASSTFPTTGIFHRSADGRLHIVSGSNGISLDQAAGASTLAVTDSSGNVGIGVSSPATKLDVSGAIRASTGILFGSDTGAANTLDDYEEGTWTGVLQDQSGNVGATATGLYTKIGRQVTIAISIGEPIALAGLTSGQDVVIKGLPFSPSASFNIFNGSVDFENVDFKNTFTTAEWYTPQLIVDGIVFRPNSPNSNSPGLECQDLNSDSAFRLTLTYFI